MKPGSSPEDATPQPSTPALAAPTGRSGLLADTPDPTEGEVSVLRNEVRTLSLNLETQNRNFESLADAIR